MGLPEHFVAYLKKQRSDNLKQLQMLEAGNLKLHEKRVGTGEIDTTPEAIKRCKATIAELDEILAKQAPDNS